MLIANPIYDVVFKYLMEDAKVAKLLIGSIIGFEILDLEFRPKSFTTQVHGSEDAIRPFFTIYHLDFSAKIKTPEEEKLVIIEVQKAKLATDILRFRQYLGKQYSDKKMSIRLQVMMAASKIWHCPSLVFIFWGIVWKVSMISRSFMLIAGTLMCIPKWKLPKKTILSKALVMIVT